MTERMKQFTKDLKTVHSQLEDNKVKVEVINLPGESLLNSGSIRFAVENPIGWAFEYLPVKREQGDSFPEIGIMIKHPDAKYTVFQLSMFDLGKYGTADNLIHKCPQYKYQNVDELEKARWVVD